jgi:fucose permease
VIFTVATLALLPSARVAVSSVFFLHGLAGGMWIARIPAVQENLALSVGALGLALLGGGLGSLLALLPAGALVARFGSRQVALWVTVPACAAVALLGLAADGMTLFGALVLWGASAGVLDMAMNAQGSALEQQRARPIMSSLHGLWSLGNLAGAAVAALVAGLGIPVRAHLVVAAPLLLVAMLVAAWPFARGDGGQSAHTAFAWPRGSLLALAVVAFCAVGTEGAMYDWAGVYLHRVLDAPEVTAAAAPTFFSAAMTIGRLGGDRVTERVPAAVLARLCAALSAVGVSAIILASTPPVVFGGLIAVGLGLSVLVPVVFSAAGRTTSMPPGTAIAAVATMAYSAFLIGPPTIGLAAEQVTLRGAFVILLVLLAVIAVLASSIGRDAAST